MTELSWQNETLLEIVIRLFSRKLSDEVRKGMPRRYLRISQPFAEYAGHIDIIALYALDIVSPTHLRDFELLMVEPWKIASTKRSSTTREYLGAIDDIERLRNEQGEFATAADFCAFWRKHSWKIGRRSPGSFRSFCKPR